MNILHLLGLRLNFTRPTQLHFFHHPAVYAALMDRFARPRPKHFPDGLSFYCPERGRVRYKEGEAYRLAFALAPSGEISTKQLLCAWQAPPRTEYAKKTGAPFGDNFKVESVRDLVSGKILEKNAPAPLTEKAVIEAAGKLRTQTQITLRFLSPILIYRTPVQAKQFIMDDRVFYPAKLLEFVVKAVRQWWPDSKIAAALPPLPPKGTPADKSPFIPYAHLKENLLIRADVSYPKKRLLGAIGKICLEFPEGVGSFAEALLLAGIVGCGHGANMGQGRFIIEGCPLPINWPPLPARTILDRAADPENLVEAREAMSKSGPAPGVDGEDRDEFLDSLTFTMPKIAQTLRKGKIDSDPLRGLLVRKRDAETKAMKIRALAIPTLRDRFLQRAVLQELDPAIEQLLEDSSFAYRKGLSPRQAQKSVTRARKEGYQYTLDADIRAFFDEVSWEKLRIRLEALLGDDPAVDAIMTWIKAPVEFDGRTVQREKGLPQGVVVSPLMANILLDDLDETIEEAGFRLVRFADDFVVLCKKKEQVSQARQVVAEQLQRLGLALNEEKTHETSFEQGFRFLGALFCRSVVLKIDKENDTVSEVLSAPADWLLKQTDDFDGKGWLADYLAEKSLEPEETDDPNARWKTPVKRPAPDQLPVYVISKDAKLQGKKQGLLVGRKDEKPHLVPWDSISELVMLGGRYVPSSVIQRCLRHRVPIAFHKWDGSPQGLLLPDRVRSPSPTAIKQWHWSEDTKAARDVARQLVNAKIRNVRIGLRRRSAELSKLPLLLKNLEEEALRTDDSERLRGIEGQAAHAYFSMWPALLSPPFQDYPGRVTRGAADPVNAMLNLLYTQLFRLTHTTLLSTGLDPYLGVLHQGRGRYAALAADLMEPFRFLVDRVVFNAVNHRQVDEGDFTYCEKGKYKLLVGKQAMKMLIEQWEETLMQEVRDTQDRTCSYRAHLYRQAESLKKLVLGREDSFYAFIMKW